MPTLIDFSDPSSTLIEKIKQLKKMKVERDDLKEKLEKITSEFEALQEEAYIMMENEGVTSVGIAGKNAFMRLDQYYSIKKGSDIGGQQWLQENGFEHLIKETVNGRSLTSELKKHKEEGGEIPGELFNLAVKQRIRGL